MYCKNCSSTIKEETIVISIILAISAIVGFYIYGETSSEMDNPQALFIGFGIGGMFVLVALLQILGRKRSKINSYEKHDKSKDSIIFCAACSSLNNIEDNNCFRCKCPLLK